MFSKDYIELCKSDKIQGLRTEFEIGDWYGEKEYPPSCVSLEVEICKGKNDYWIPLSGQLDEEIKRIVDIKTQWLYTFMYSRRGQFSADIADEYGKVIASFEGRQPLTVKIKLLLELLSQ